MAVKNTVHGNRAVLKLDGEVIGIVQNVDFNDSFGLQKLSGIGDREGQELVDGETDYSFNFTKSFVYGDRLVDKGFHPTSTNPLTGVEFEMEIYDKISGRTLEYYSGCKINTVGRSYGKHAIVMENASGMALSKLK